MRELMSEIREKMDVYDSTDNNIGHVGFVYVGEQHAEAGEDESPNLDGDSATHIDEENLPSNASDNERHRLVREGYIRIENAIFSGASYADATQIDRIEDGSVYLNITQDKVIRE